MSAAAKWVDGDEQLLFAFSTSMALPSLAGSPPHATVSLETAKEPASHRFASRISNRVSAAAKWGCATEWGDGDEPNSCSLRFPQAWRYPAWLAPPHVTLFLFRDGQEAVGLAHAGSPAPL